MWNPARRSARGSRARRRRSAPTRPHSCAIDGEPDPALRPGEDPVLAVAAREGLHARRVGAGGGLGEAEAADHLAARHPRQPLLLLLLAAPAVDRAHRQRALHRHERADAGVAGLELEGGEPVLDGAAAGASVSVECHAEDAELAEGRRELGGKLRPVEPVGDVRADSRIDEGPHAVAHGALVVSQQRVDAEDVGCRAQRLEIVGVPGRVALRHQLTSSSRAQLLLSSPGRPGFRPSVPEDDRNGGVVHAAQPPSCPVAWAPWCGRRRPGTADERARGIRVVRSSTSGGSGRPQRGARLLSAPSAERDGGQSVRVRGHGRAGGDRRGVLRGVRQRLPHGGRVDHQFAGIGHGGRHGWPVLFSAFGALLPIVVVGGALAAVIVYLTRGTFGRQERWYRLDRFATANGMALHARTRRRPHCPA